MPEGTYAVVNPEPSNRPLVVSGSVSTTPSGTQNVAITSPLPVPTYSTTPPTITGAYGFSQPNIAGVAAANNFISVFNPIGSGKTLILSGVFISSTAGGGTAVTDPMTGFRVTAASAGTLQAASAIVKFATSYADTVAEVRINNPTVTLGAQIFNSPPVISATVGSTTVHSITLPSTPQFTLAPGEGIVIRTAAGDTDQRWNMSVVWAEI